MYNSTQEEEYMTQKIITHTNKRPKNSTQKTPLQIIEEKYGKEPAVTSDLAIRKYLESKGYKSLSKLIANE